ALRARGDGWNVIARLRRRRQQVRGERGRVDVTGATIARGRVLHIERGVGPRISRRGAGTGDHPEVWRRFMAGGAREPCAGRGGVAGGAQGRTRDAGRAELEATRIDVARRMAARAVAVEAAYGEVIGGHPDDRDRIARRRADERTGVRAMAAQTPADPLVDSGD